MHIIVLCVMTVLLEYLTALLEYLNLLKKFEGGGGGKCPSLTLEDIYTNALKDSRQWKTIACEHDMNKNVSNYFIL